jgi:DNA-directed RNA polymerase specialized sigma24 family protein
VRIEEVEIIEGRPGEAGNDIRLRLDDASVARSLPGCLRPGTTRPCRGVSQADARAAVDPAGHLAALLGLLCPEPDADAQAAAYERVRAKLVDLFRWRGLPDPGALADETLERVGQKAAEGLELERSPTAYVLGVAKMVALEADRRARREVALPPSETLPAPVTDAEVERRAQALDACLAALAPDERTLVLEYHRGEGRARIEGRQRLAERFGTSVVNLRVKVFRLRGKLERCVKKRLGDDMDAAESARRAT